MKKILAVVLSAFIALAAFPALSFASDSGSKQALPLSAGIEALRGQFEAGVSSGEEGEALDYRYYSPVGENDSSKYPLVIFLHGIGHGDYEGSQLDDSDMPYWSSAEFQARFDDADGAFILLPRCHEEQKIYWNESLVDDLYRLITEFIDDHRDNIDLSRISVMGSSQGGAMVWYMIETYPDMFSCAVPIASTVTPSAKDIKTASSVAIWIVASKLDPVVNYHLSTLTIWRRVCKYNDAPENCRLTSFKEVYNPDGTSASDNHHLAKVITCDLHTLSGEEFPDVETVDGVGNTIDLSGENGLIKWMSAVHSDYDGTTERETGGQDSFWLRLSAYFSNYFLSIVRQFQIMLGL